LECIYNSERRLRQEYKELAALILREQQGNIPYSRLLSSRYVYAVVLGSLVHFFAIYDGYLLLIYFSTLIFSSMSETGSDYKAIKCSILLGVVDVSAVLLYSKFSDSAFTYLT
jgi:hypothetical protein